MCKVYLFLYYAYECFDYVCMYSMMPRAHGGQMRVLDPVVLKLQMLLSHHVDTGKQTLGPLK